jgi:putative ABC transport system substrate-binding protein
MRHREFIALGGAAAVTPPSLWPPAARAQQPGLPVVAFVSGRSAAEAAGYAAAFRKGLNGTGVIEGQNVTAEYLWLDGQYDRSPSLMTDLVRRRVAVIAIPGNAPASLAAKAATTTIPIVFRKALLKDPKLLGMHEGARQLLLGMAAEVPV